MSWSSEYQLLEHEESSLRTKKEMRYYLRHFRRHDSFAALVLSKGEWFLGRANVDDSEATKRWKKKNRPRAQECFYNAQRFCMNCRGRYFEGYMFIGGLPMHHAWVAMDDGRVVDFTIEAVLRKARREKTLVDLTDPLYCGVEVPRKFVLRRVVESGSSDPMAELYYVDEST